MPRTTLVAFAFAAALPFVQQPQQPQQPAQPPPQQPQQQPGTPAQHHEPPAADPKDVASVDAIVAALYDVISGPAGQKRDWNRMRSLFHPDAHLVVIVKLKDGNTRVIYLTAEDYVARSGPHLEADGFFEQEIARKTDTYGDLVQVFSTYTTKKTPADPQPFMRGINSIQLGRQQGRWYVLQIAWEAESDAGPLPAQYLPVK
jgi:hypothetical protein